MTQLKINKTTSPDQLSAGGKVEIVNWTDYPYRPEVRFSMGYTTTHLYIKFLVTEKNIKANYLNDNEAVWEDSCVEFFVKDPNDDHYYNFETNCIGTALAARRRSKTEAEHLSEESMQRIIRVSSLPHQKIDKRDNNEEWSLLLGIPFDLIGYSEPPATLLANIYKCGDMTEEPHFLSWAPITSATPNFHLPEFFAKIELV